MRKVLLACIASISACDLREIFCCCWGQRTVEPVPPAQGEIVLTEEHRTVEPVPPAQGEIVLTEEQIKNIFSKANPNYTENAKLLEQAPANPLDVQHVISVSLCTLSKQYKIFFTPDKPDPSSQSRMIDALTKLELLILAQSEEFPVAVHYKMQKANQGLWKVADKFIDRSRANVYKLLIRTGIIKIPSDTELAFEDKELTQLLGEFIEGDFKKSELGIVYVFGNSSNATLYCDVYQKQDGEDVTISSRELSFKQLVQANKAFEERDAKKSAELEAQEAVLTLEKRWDSLIRKAESLQEIPEDQLTSERLLDEFAAINAMYDDDGLFSANHAELYTTKDIQFKRALYRSNIGKQILSIINLKEGIIYAEKTISDESKMPLPTLQPILESIDIIMQTLKESGHTLPADFQSRISKIKERFEEALEIQSKEFISAVKQQYEVFINILHRVATENISIIQPCIQTLTDLKYKYNHAILTRDAKMQFIASSLDFYMNAIQPLNEAIDAKEKLSSAADAQEKEELRKEVDYLSLTLKINQYLTALPQYQDALNASSAGDFEAAQRNFESFMQSTSDFKELCELNQQILKRWDSLIQRAELLIEKPINEQLEKQVFHEFVMVDGDSRKFASQDNVSNAGEQFDQKLELFNGELGKSLSGKRIKYMIDLYLSFFPNKTVSQIIEKILSALKSLDIEEIHKRINGLTQEYSEKVSNPYEFESMNNLRAEIEKCKRTLKALEKHQELLPRIRKLQSDADKYMHSSISPTIVEYVELFYDLQVLYETYKDEVKTEFDKYFKTTVIHALENGALQSLNAEEIQKRIAALKKEEYSSALKSAAEQEAMIKLQAIEKHGGDILPRTQQLEADLAQYKQGDQSQPTIQKLVDAYIGLCCALDSHLKNEAKLVLQEEIAEQNAKLEALKIRSNHYGASELIDNIANQQKYLESVSEELEKHPLLESLYKHQKELIEKREDIKGFQICMQWRDLFEGCVQADEKLEVLRNAASMDDSPEELKAWYISEITASLKIKIHAQEERLAALQNSIKLLEKIIDDKKITGVSAKRLDEISKAKNYIVNHQEYLKSVSEQLNDGTSKDIKLLHKYERYLRYNRARILTFSEDINACGSIVHIKEYILELKDKIKRENAKFEELKVKTSDESLLRKITIYQKRLESMDEELIEIDNQDTSSAYWALKEINQEIQGWQEVF